MGWSFAIDLAHKKDAEVARLVRWQQSADAFWPLVDHRVVGNHLWMVVRNRDTGATHAALYLIKSGFPTEGWGHKSVSHIEYLDCPNALLALLSPPENEAETRWREAVKERHAEQAAKRRAALAVKIGDAFAWNGGRLLVISVEESGTHLTVKHQIQRKGKWWDCETYRAKRSTLAALVPFENTNKPTSTAENPQEPKGSGELDQQALFA